MVTATANRRLSQLSLGSLGWVRITTFVVAGAFTAVPENGFPVGTPDAPVAEMSWHGVVHSVALTAVAAIMPAVGYARARRVGPAVLSGAAALVLLVPEFMSNQIAVYGVVALAWTVVALSLRTGR